MDAFTFAHKNARDIVWMSQNTNQLPICPRLEEAILRAVKDREYNLYPRAKGLFGLCEAIAGHLSLPEDYSVLLTNGGIEGFYILARTFLKEGDEVVCTDPSFLPLHHIVKVSGGNLVELPIYSEPWKLTPDRVIEAITPKTRMILLIDPINPLGTAYTRDEVKAISDIASEHDLLLVDDITYRDFSEPTGTYEFASERTLVSYTFSKNCGLAGMRIGCVAAPMPLMDRMLPFNTNVLSVNILAQRAALAALECMDDWLPRMRTQLMMNQEIIKCAVERVEGCSLPVFPSRTNMFCVDISRTGKDPDDVQNRMLFEHKVFVRSGNYVSKRFGENFIRVSFSVPQEGAERFAEAFPLVMEHP
jgi:aspartate aminotransferase